ncbi:MAG: hypothetical protein LBB27_03035 [Tannerellaceae bacterium]|jgi:hypothetical protein|nr:hypothetical protein [Tannerellaceae bacterium]
MLRIVYDPREEQEVGATLWICGKVVEYGGSRWIEGKLTDVCPSEEQIKQRVGLQQWYGFNCRPDGEGRLIGGFGTGLPSSMWQPIEEAIAVHYGWISGGYAMTEEEKAVVRDILERVWEGDIEKYQQLNSKCNEKDGNGAGRV